MAVVASCGPHRVAVLDNAVGGGEGRRGNELSGDEGKEGDREEREGGKDLHRGGDQEVVTSGVGIDYRELGSRKEGRGGRRGRREIVEVESAYI